jgi:GTPase SAR1 family protein/gas vesicle protein
MEPLIRPPMPAKPPWADVSPLAGHPLAAKLDVTGRLKWIDVMVAKYGLSTVPKKPLFHDVKQTIDRRQRESRLFLGVVGEFSSGKSTLINALTRETLLRTDVLQGTTAAATLLYFGESLAVNVRHHKKNLLANAVDKISTGVKSFIGLFQTAPPPPTRDDLLALIHQSTSDEEFAKDILQVDVELPADTLRSGLVIVDTPGANAANSRHGIVTSSALRDLCDAALVVVPAEAAGSESLMSFLKEHAADVLHRCVFIVTKVDLLRRKSDRDRVLTSLHARLSQQLGISNPRVLAAAPQFMVERVKADRNSRSKVDSARPSENDGYTAEEIEEWVRHFAEMETSLRSLLRDKRLQAQADDIAKLLRDLYDRLKTMIERLLEDHRQRHEALEKLVIPNIHEFIESRASHYADQASTGIQRAMRGEADKFQRIAGGITRDLLAAINGASNRKELKAAVESTIPSVLSSGQRSLRSHVDGMLRRIAKAGQAELKAFHGEFQTHYRSLATLGGALKHDGSQVTLATANFGNTTRGISTEIASGLQQIEQQQTNQLLGSGAIGAALGTIVLPGVGTLVGGAIGAALSSMFGPSLQELKVACWNRLQPAVEEKLQEVAQIADQAVDAACRDTVRQLVKTIFEYGPKYEALVEQMRRRDADEKASIQQMQRTIYQDLQAIDGQRQDLDALCARIRDL